MSFRAMLMVRDRVRVRLVVRMCGPIFRYA